MESLNSKSVIRWKKFMAFGSRLGCHQMPERSFFIKGYQFFVCARCTGVISGEIIAIATFFFIKPSLILSLLLLIPMAVDWGLQYLKILESTNIRRFISGLISSIGLTFLYIKFFVFIFKLLIKLFS